MSYFECPNCCTAYNGFPFFKCVKCGQTFLATASELGLDENTIFINGEPPSVPQEIADYWQEHLEEYGTDKPVDADICNEIWQKICAEKKYNRMLADIETERVCAEATMRTLEKYGSNE